MAKGLLLGGLTEAAGVFLKAYGDVCLAKRPDEQKYCYKDPDVGGIGNGREMWAVIGPAIVHTLTVLGGVVVLKHDRCWILGPHGLLNGLRDEYDNFDKLTIREVEIIVDSVVAGPDGRLGGRQSLGRNVPPKNTVYRPLAPVK